MDMGPVEYLLVAFPGSQFDGSIAPALLDLVESGNVRIIDLAFLKKDRDGTVSTFEYDALDDGAPFSDIPGHAGGLIGEDDLALSAEQLEPGSSAALVVWEDVWARQLADSVRNAGGVIVTGGRIAHDLVCATLDELQTIGDDG